MNLEQYLHIQSRRSFLHHCVGGLGTAALAHLLAREGRAASSGVSVTDPLAPKPPHFIPRAKNVIFLFMAGAPSQIDLFDPKPELHKWHGKPFSPSLTEDLQLAFIKPSASAMASPREFVPCGESGMEITDWLPHTRTIADEICLVRSMESEAFNHHPGQSLLMSGSTLVGRPTVGSWVTYGLGSESENLPGFVVLSSGRGTSGGASNWSRGFLPTSHEGVVFRNSGDLILFLSNPPGVSSEMQRLGLDALRDLNSRHREETGDQEISSRIASYELAFRMQSAAPDLLDFSDEPRHVREMYGIDEETTQQYGTNCLLARRMVERGVRFVMLAHASWDQHNKLNEKLKENCDITDKPAAALIKDLNSEAYLTRPWSFGEESSAAHPWPKCPRPSRALRTAQDETIIPRATACGSPVGASREVR